MFRIAICDDESTICSQIEKIILGAHRIINEEIEIEVWFG
jgi:DNA-binding LytR/AlgR family response regulator